MQLGVIGLDRAGENIVRRLTRAGHDCVVFDQNAPTGKSLVVARFRSHDREGSANKLRSAMRQAFGGHVEPK